MISIVMTYYNRFEQFAYTVKSIIEQLNNSNLEVELIVVNDCSTDKMDLNIDNRINVITLKKEDKWYTCSCVPFNIGISRAKGDIIILQNAECCHVGNVLEYVQNNLTEENYLTFSTYALDLQRSELFRNITSDYRKQFIGKLPQTRFNKLGWYNHTCNPTYYHFCSAITRKNMDLLGGFDERYSDGIAFDDNELVERITRLGLRKEIITEPFVVHQWHSKVDHFSVTNYSGKHEMNRRLFYNTTMHETETNVSKWRKSLT